MNRFVAAIVVAALAATGSSAFARTRHHVRQSAMHQSSRTSATTGGSGGAVGATGATQTGVNGQAGSGGAAGGMGR